MGTRSDVHLCATPPGGERARPALGPLSTLSSWCALFREIAHDLLANVLPGDAPPPGAGDLAGGRAVPTRGWVSVPTVEHQQTQLLKGGK